MTKDEVTITVEEKAMFIRLLEKELDERMENLIVLKRLKKESDQKLAELEEQIRKKGKQ